ncbi:hypothetical protein C8J57DRAFT_1611111 [Mycena rebaudengoi]|nr:hypothetical protein C8J57DRAFT_1611111 [Mycena rebaudengoi]
MMRKHEGGVAVALRCASFGHNGAWVCVEEDGKIRSQGLSDNIKAALDKKAVRNIQLSAHSPTVYFIEYVTGETNWEMPVSWGANIENITKISVRRDNLGIPGEQIVTQRIIFAFGHEIDTYFISNGEEAYWQGIGSSDVEGKMLAFSLGEDGAYFWRQGGSRWLSGRTKMAYPEVWRIFNSSENINWVAFGPQGYYIVDTDSHIYASRSNTILRNDTSGSRVPLRCGSFGHGGAWVVVEDDGVISSSGLSDAVLEMVKVGNVRNIQLSMTDPDECYIEYMDGSIGWTLPKSWHDKVSQIEDNLDYHDQPPLQLSKTWSSTRAGPSSELYTARLLERKDIFICCICICTLHKPVVLLCMHIFCYACIHQNLRERNCCPVCRAPIRGPPIRDDAFERELFDAIGEGLIEAPTADLPTSLYNWDEVDFATDNN